ncbi:MAG: Mrp/NBP35 family ATP-binding protein [Actinomycetota bacterium]|nr:Mrp/NBP35 family ATP-binding protein [Actinomycetota bacterium]
MGFDDRFQSALDVGASLDPADPQFPPVARFVILVASGKGGVGKSTISLNLSLALVEQGASVGLLDADVYAPDIPLMVNLRRKQHRKSWPMYRNPRLRAARMEPVERFGLKVMSAGFLIGEDQSMSFPASSVSFVLNQLVRQVDWGELEYLIVDLPPGTADVQQHLVLLLRPSGALIVVGSQDAAHLDAKKVVSMFREQGVRVLGGVENMHCLECPHCHRDVEIFPRVRASRAIWSMGVKQLGELPFEPQLAQAAERGTPLLVAAPESAQAQRFRQLAERVAAQCRHA